MKLSQLIQFLLLGLILLGLFAIMAQNSYGFTLVGLSCFGLALLFVAQGIFKVTENFSVIERHDIAGIAELFLLSSLISLFGLRAFYINIPYGDWIFIVLSGALIVVYFNIASWTLKTLKTENHSMAFNLGFFYLSTLLFLLSMGTRIINPSISLVTGSIGFLTAIPFLISLVRNKLYDYQRKTISLLQFVITSKNKVGMLFLIFMFSAIYVGLSTLKIIPSIGNSDKPGTYIELINQAETGKEKPVNGKYQHEIYKDAMDKFLARHGNNKHE